QTAEVIQLDQRRLEKRKAHVKAAVECLIWTEAESPEALDAFKEKFEELLDIETQDAETFEQEPLDAQIQRLAWVIGLDSPPPCGEGAGGGGVSAEPADPDTGPQLSSPTHSQHPHPNPSPSPPPLGVASEARGAGPQGGPQGGGAVDDPFHPSG
ncbi:MAG TPA: hypothetical protein VGT80_03320, partial [Phenylobacterium sp.]|nr:hypothetical protein [Phenylobacterium sp.]